MQQIVGSLVFQDPVARAIPTVSPWIDVRFRGTADEMHRAISAQTHRRFLKSHLPADGLPIHDEVRYIAVARDGRDALMSAHNHFSGHSEAMLANLDRIGLEDPTIGRPCPRVPEDVATYFRLWISTPAVAGQSDGYTHLSFFDTVASYWAERARENFLLVHFNDLLADLDGEMRRIARFLDIAVDPTVWPALLQAASFERMQAQGEALMPQTRSMFADGRASRFFNKGTNGRWRNVLTADDLAAFDAKVREKFSPELAAWHESGRIVSGEPRSSTT
jgi:aryl sulfotransferase